jgi:hypothetical protein
MIGGPISWGQATLADSKPNEDYVSQLDGRTLTRARTHERLVDFGLWCAGGGFAPSTIGYPVIVSSGPQVPNCSLASGWRAGAG